MNVDLLTKQILAACDRYALNLDESQARKMAIQMIREMQPAAQHRAMTSLVESLTKLSV